MPRERTEPLGCRGPRERAQRRSTSDGRRVILHEQHVEGSASSPSRGSRVSLSLADTVAGMRDGTSIVVCDFCAPRRPCSAPAAACTKLTHVSPHPQRDMTLSPRTRQWSGLRPGRVGVDPAGSRPCAALVGPIAIGVMRRAPSLKGLWSDRPLQMSAGRWSLGEPTRKRVRSRTRAASGSTATECPSTQGAPAKGARRRSKIRWL